MEELAYHKTKDKGTISLMKTERGWVVAKFSASDIEEWSVEHAHEDEAWKAFRGASAEE